MLEELKIQRDIIALEAFSVPNPNALLKNFLPSITNTLKDFSLHFKESKVHPALGLKEQNFLKALEHLNYMDLASLPMEDTIGLASTLPKFLDDLNALSNSLLPLEAGVLTPFSEYCAKLITSSQHKFDTSNNFSKIESVAFEVKAKFEQVNKDLAPRPTYKKEYQNFIARNSDWQTVFGFLNTITRNVDEAHRVKEISRCVEQISTYLALIDKKAKAGELEGVSPEVVKTLSEGAYECAHLVEIYSLLCFHLMATRNTISRIMDKITALQ